MTDAICALVFGCVIPFVFVVVRHEYRLRQWRKDRKRRELWNLRSHGE